jgi:hypothetical protein
VRYRKNLHAVVVALEENHVRETMNQHLAVRTPRTPSGMSVRPFGQARNGAVNIEDKLLTQPWFAFRIPDRRGPKLELRFGTYNDASHLARSSLSNRSRTEVQSSSSDGLASAA